MLCLIQIIRGVVAKVSVNEITVMICKQVVTIMKMRLQSDLESILHGDLIFDANDDDDDDVNDDDNVNDDDDNDDNSNHHSHHQSTNKEHSSLFSFHSTTTPYSPRTTSDDYLQLFYAILSDTHQFDLYLQQTWGITPTLHPSAFLIPCFQQEEIFSYWLMIDKTRYQDFIQGLAEDREATSRFQLILNTVIDRYSSLIGKSYQIRYYQFVIQSLLDRFLSMLTTINPITYKSIHWELVQRLLEDIEAYERILNDFAEREEFLEVFEANSELTENFADLHSELSTKKRQVLDGITSIISTTYCRQVLDEVIQTELFTCPSPMDFPHHRILTHLATGKGQLETSFLTIQQWCSPRVYRGVRYRILRAIDMEVQERVQRVHYHREGAAQIVRILKDILSLATMIPAGETMPAMKVGV